MLRKIKNLIALTLVATGLLLAGCSGSYHNLCHEDNTCNQGLVCVRFLEQGKHVHWIDRCMEPGTVFVDGKQVWPVVEVKRVQPVAQVDGDVK